MTAHRGTPLSLVAEQTIGGAAVEGDGEPIEIPDPATGRPLGKVGTASQAQVLDAIAAARRAFDDGPWPRMAPAERAGHIDALADALERHRDEMVATLVSEVGTPISTAVPMQFEVPLATLRWMARAAALDRTEHLGHDLGMLASASFVAYRPAGVIAAITAYNYPLTLAAWKLGAAMAAGCTTVLMPSPRTPFATTLLGRLTCEAGIPPGVVNVVVGGADAGRLLSTHPDVDKVSFTGSDVVGRQVMTQAADSLKGVALELGGKSPNIVLPGTDLPSVVPAMHMRYARNAGQGCAVPTRLLVPADRIDEFIECSARMWPALVTGDPWDPATIVGPLIRPEHRDRVAAYVEDARADGARVIAGGNPIDLDGGWYYEPTLIGPVDNSMRIAQEEIFGPVAVLIPYRGIEQAVRIANDSAYGLSANVYGPDLAECLEVAGRLRSGTVTVNGGGGFRPDAPFGGFKRSGVGRELGEWGIREFLEPQHVQFSLSPPPAAAPPRARS